MFTGTLSVNQGDYFSYTSNALDNNGNYLDLSNLTGAAFLKLKYGDSGILDQFNFNIINPVSGLYNISLNPSNTSAYPVGQGIYGVYVFSNQLNQNPLQSGIAQGYINIFPELVSNFSGLFLEVNPGNTGIPVDTYFGATNLNISGSVTYHDSLALNQGYKTTYLNVTVPVASYISYIYLDQTNAFKGAIINYNIIMPEDTYPPAELIFFNWDGSELLTQPPISGSVFIQFGYDGTNWKLNQWA